MCVRVFTFVCVNIYAIRLATKRGCCNGSDSRVINSRTDGDSVSSEIGRRFPVITATASILYICVYGETAEPRGRSESRGLPLACRHVSGSWKINFDPSSAGQAKNNCPARAMLFYTCIYCNELAGISYTARHIIILLYITVVRAANRFAARK